MKALLMLTAVAGLLGVCRVSYLLIGPEVDNLVGVLRSRDVRLFLDHQVRGRPLGDVLRRRVGACAWSSRHHDVMWATDIECKGPDGRVFAWELSHVAPRRWLAKQDIYITPLNRAAGEATPELLPVGVCPEDLSEKGYRAGAVHDVGRQPGDATPLATLLGA